MSDNKIVYTTTGVFIMPYSIGQSKYLEKETSTFDKICHKWIPHTGFYNDKLKLFATYNMSQDKLKEIFPHYSTVYMNSYRGKPLKKRYNMNVELNKYQSSAITQLIGVKGHEAYINIPTASGKTVLAVSFITLNEKKTFIMCYSSRILSQWITTFKEKTDIDPKRILSLSSSELMNSFLLPDSERKKKDPKPENYDIFLCTSTMMDSFGKRYGYEKLQTLFMELGIGLKIIDEAHTRLGSTIRLNAYTSIDKTLYLSADFNQANRELMYQFRRTFKRVPVIKLEENLMNELRHITAINCIYKTKPSSKERLAIVSNQYAWSTIEYCRYEFNHEDIMRLINTTVRAIVDAESKMKLDKPYKILILTQLIEHVDLIYDKLKCCGRTKSKLYATLEEDVKSTATDADIIISTYKSFSTGIDVTNPQIRHVISTSPVDAVTANQSAGRCRPINGLKSYFWMFQDYAFEYCSGNADRVIRYLKTNKIGDVTEYKIGDENNATVQIEA